MRLRKNWRILAIYRSTEDPGLVAEVIVGWWREWSGNASIREQWGCGGKRHCPGCEMKAAASRHSGCKIISNKEISLNSDVMYHTGLVNLQEMHPFALFGTKKLHVKIKGEAGWVSVDMPDYRDTSIRKPVWNGCQTGFSIYSIWNHAHFVGMLFAGSETRQDESGRTWRAVRKTWVRRISIDF